MQTQYAYLILLPSSRTSVSYMQIFRLIYINDPSKSVTEVCKWFPNDVKFYVYDNCDGLNLPMNSMKA